MAAQTQNSDVLIPLSRGQRRAVTAGGICLMLSISIFGVGFFVIQGAILTQMDAFHYYSLLTIFATLGLTIMTPIGGKLGDLFGRRNVVVISGIICAVCGIGMAVIRSIIPFILLRLLLGAAQGAFTAAPYILTREINEPKDVPKAMGLLASAVAVGGFAGSILLGALADMGYLGLAILLPVVPLLIGVVLIAMNVPGPAARRGADASVSARRAKNGHATMDAAGLLWLSVLLSAFCLAANYGPVIGWTDFRILAGFLVAVVSLILFIRTEKKAVEPVVPISLFENRYYTAMLVVSFICYFYQTAMNVYDPLAVQQIMGASAAAAGSLQLPRTILTMILPAAAGVWVSRRKKNFWIAMALASGLTAAAYVPLCFTSPDTSLMVYMAALALTGIAESFRAVSVTTAAQASLPPENLGIGTSLITFANSLSGLVAAAVYGVIHGMNPNSLQAGINGIHLFTVLISVAGLLIVLFPVRKALDREP